MGYEYGICPCGGSFERRNVDVTITTLRGPVKLDQMQQAACPNCGSRVYKLEVIQLLEVVMKIPWAPS